MTKMVTSLLSLKGEAINPDVWVSEKAVTKVFDAELSADIIYEVRLCEYDTNRQIDIYTFDNTYSHLYRKTVDGGIILMNQFYKAISIWVFFRLLFIIFLS